MTAHRFTCYDSQHHSHHAVAPPANEVLGWFIQGLCATPNKPPQWRSFPVSVCATHGTPQPSSHILMSHTNSVARGAGSCPVQTGITAAASGTHADAVDLIAGFNFVTTVAGAADSVRLPKARTGLIVRVKNDTATSMEVFPFYDSVAAAAGGETINGAAADASESVAGGASVTYVAVSDSAWEACN